MSLNTVKCPRCYSNKLYKFGFDKQDNQKYQCQDCKRQFTEKSNPYFKKSHYPVCPRCSHKTYLHHKYEHYNRFKCGNRQCNHILVKYHSININPTSNHLIDGSTSLKGMRYPLHVVLLALNLYFNNNSSTRNIAHLFEISFNINVSHVTIYKWTIKFSKLFRELSEFYSEKLNFDSDDWHADETAVFIKGKRYYLWLVIDSETRFVLAYHLTQSRGESSAFSVINSAKRLGTSKNVITDRLPSYNEALKVLLPNSKHIAVTPKSSDINNNLIESFNKTFKAWYKCKKGFNSFESANKLISNFLFNYNFLRPHGSLNNLTPANVAGFNSNTNSWFLSA